MTCGTFMPKTMYIDGIEIGEVLDMDYTLDGEDATVVKIPAGESEVIVPITVSNVRNFMEGFMEVFHLSDAEVFKEFIREGGELSPYTLDKLNALSMVLTRDGEQDYTYKLILFEDGTTWTG